jgi:hypothetical protein
MTAARSLELSLLAVLGLSITMSSAHTLQRAEASKCGPDSASTARAAACLAQGRLDIRAGVKHPHYVACTAVNKVFCCSDNAEGDQTCGDASATTRTDSSGEFEAKLNRLVPPSGSPTSNGTTNQSPVNGR